MPIHRVTVSGKPGWQWGNHGKVYFYRPGNKGSEKEAKKRAIQQGLAASYEQGKKPEL